LLRSWSEPSGAGGDPDQQAGDKQEGELQARRMRDEPDQRRPGQDTGIAKRRDGRHGDMFRHRLLAAHGGKENWNYVGAAGTNQCEAGKRGNRSRYQRRQDQSAGRQQAACETTIRMAPKWRTKRSPVSRPAVMVAANAA